ncbi:MAG: hypothetical protein ISS70_25550 [Phycisphaerae bacterium]|nr:hypothetical protein [Phycisphaerae bacterium]
MWRTTSPTAASRTFVTLGLNWYFNPNTKLMFKYVRALIDHDSYDGDLDIFQMRAQVDF